MTIADLKAMLDRYQDNLNYYENKLYNGETIDDVYKERITELRSRVYHISRQLEMLMDEMYDSSIEKI